MALAPDGVIRSGRQLVTLALRELGVIAGAERDPTTEDLASGIEHLEELIDAWGLEFNLLPTLKPHPFTASASKSAYTIGEAGADVALARPTYVQGVSWRTAPTDAELPLEVIPWSEWPAFDKVTTAATPDRYFYDGGVDPSTAQQTVGRTQISAVLATLHVLPVPTAAGTVTLYVPGAVGNFSVRDTKVLMPRGWALAVRLNLAVKMSRDMRKPLSRTLLHDARMAKQKIENANTVNRGLRSAEPVFPASRARGPFAGFGGGFGLRF